MSTKPTAVADGDEQILGAAVRVGDAVDLAGTLQGIVAAAREALGADRASCYVVSQDGVIEAVHTTEEDAKRRGFLEAGVGLGPERVPVWRLLLAQDDPLLVSEDPSADVQIPDAVVSRLGTGAFVGARLEHPSIEKDGAPALLGALFCTFREPRPIRPEQRAAARGLARLATLAVANARMQLETAQNLEEHRVLAAEQAALRRVATQVAAEAEPADVFARVAEEAAGLLGVECGLVLQYGPTTAIPRGWWGAGENAEPSFPLDGGGAIAEVARSGRPARVDDYGPLAADPAGQFARSGGYHSAVAAPVRVDGRLWGALLAATTEEAPIGADAEGRLEHFAELVALAILNAETRTRLAAQAASDPLTGLANHRAFFERLHAETSRARREQRPLSLVLIDLDHFKQVNDQHGHLVGDRVLVEVARRLTDGAREEDVLARIGGEEFAWLLPECDAETGWAAAERARRAIAGTIFPGVGPVTMSAGVAELAEGTSINELFRAADAALYWAKDQGRDVCVSYTADHDRAVAGAPSGSRLAPSVDRLLALAREQLGLTLATVGEFADDKLILRYTDGDAAVFGFHLNQEIPREETYCHRVMSGQLPNLIRDARGEAATRAFPAARTGPVGAYVGVPIPLPGGAVYGMLCCVSPNAEPALGDRDTRLLGMLASMIGEELDRESRGLRARLRQRQGIQRVLEGEGLSIVLQPIVDLADGRVVAAEALSRFDGVPHRGPDIWFAEAAAVGLELELQLVAIRAALKRLDELPSGARLSVNVSPSVLAAPELVEAFAGFPGERLAVELTEHVPVSDYGALGTAMECLRGNGVWLMIDDAGAGFSSLQHILGLHPDVIKLDVALSRDIDTDPVRRALAASLVGFAREIGAIIVAEGIETQHELETLQALGVTHGQGYHLAPPSSGPVPRRLGLGGLPLIRARTPEGVPA